MTINILCFGITKDIIGSFHLSMEIPEESNTSFLMRQLQNNYPGLKDLTSLRLALNNEYTTTTEILKDGDEIALIPPVSGG